MTLSDMLTIIVLFLCALVGGTWLWTVIAGPDPDL